METESKSISRRTFLALTAAGVLRMTTEVMGESLERKFSVDRIGPAAMPGVPDEVQRFEFTSDVDGLRDWGLVLPSSSDTWVVFVHGHGSGGDQLFTRPDMRDSWLPDVRKRGLGILTVNVRGNSWMCPSAARDVNCVLGYAREKWGVKKFVFASGSMGATSNLIYAVLHPEDVAGVVALCPATDLSGYHAWCEKSTSPIAQEIAKTIERFYGGRLKDRRSVYAAHSAMANAAKLRMPVYVCHGNADAIIPVSQSRQLVGRMGDTASFAYVEIPDGDHEAPLGSFAEGFDWVLRKLVTND